MNKFTKAIAAIMLIVAAIIVTGCNKPDEPNNGGNNNGQNDSIVNPNDNGGNNNGQNDSIVDHSGTLNGHDYVDLGLPSGTLWATCNVGAETPEGYGDYFAWGETEPKENYDWITYKYCNGDFDQLTKYCQDATYGYDGYTDDLYRLLPMDDAATANWGEGWRMPTAGQGDELLSVCSHQRETINGVKGWRIIGTNGNSIFLPAGGAKGEFIGPSPESLQVGGDGYFWVNDRSYAFNHYMMGDYDHLANFIALPVAYSTGGWTQRMIGMTVRAVRSAE